MGRCMILDLGLILTSITFSRRSVSDCTSFQLMRPPGFFGSRPFSQINAFLQENGEQPVDWRLP